jgi:large conductance mechanosensitive channel
VAEARSKSSTQAGKDGEVHLNRSIPAVPPQQQLQPIKVPHPFQGFIDFVREQGVVGIGVGFVIGTAATTLVKSFVTNMITPLIGLTTGGIDFSKKVVCLNSTADVCKNTLNYGQVISDFITFLAILLVVYVIVRRLKLESLDKKKDA